MTSDEAVRHAALAQALIDARDWRDTFEMHENHKGKLNVVEFAEAYLRDRVKDTNDNQGFDGSLSMPRDIAIEMLQWLEQRVTKELEKPHEQANPLPRF